MQVYRGMDIGTDKPSARDRKAVAHHLIDIVPPSRNFSVFDYRERALKAISAIVRKGKLPIVCGGSGLYVRALIQGLDRMPPPDLKLRSKLESELAVKGAEALFAKLKKIDPKRAAEIDAKNPRRIIRALEVAHNLKNSPKHKAEPSLSDLGYRPVVFGIRRERQELYQAIGRRVDQMFRRGLAGEAKKLFRTRISMTASQALGYREIRSGGDGERLREEIKRNTRHFAKRQLTWFKKEPEIHWIDASLKDTPRNLSLRIQRLFATRATD